MYRWYTDKACIRYQLGVCIRCQSSVGGSPTTEFSVGKAKAQYPFEAKARVTNWRRHKAEGDEGERRGESVLKRLGRYYYEEKSVPT